MRVIRPYGRTATGEEPPGHVQRIEPSPRASGSGSPDAAQSIAGFLGTHPEAVIAHWISIIDRIATKPKGEQGATSAQRSLRTRLGTACWRRLTDGDDGAFSGLDPDRLADLEGIWLRKIHPYGDRVWQPRSRGDKPPDWAGWWYSRLCGNTQHRDVDADRVAARIEGHLYRDALRLSGGTRRSPHSTAEPKGLIQLRAESIEKRVLNGDAVRRLGPEAMAETGWSNDDVEVYCRPGDIARQIHAAAVALEEDDRRVTTRLSGQLLYAHFGEVFRLDGELLGRREAEERMPGVYALHEAVRESYSRMLKRHRKKYHRAEESKLVNPDEEAKFQAGGISRSLPPDMRALLRRINAQTGNRSLNALVRLGRVIHHEASERARTGAGGAASGSGAARSSGNGQAEPTGDRVADIVANWPGDVGSSRFWTSQGQVEIGRTEAFVRAWRPALAHAQRTMTDWIDPERQVSGKRGAGPGDILLAEPRDRALGCVDPDHLREKARLLFGDALDTLDGDDPGALARFVCLELGRIRNNSFHFQGVAGFVGNLRAVGSKGAPEDQQAAESLIKKGRRLWAEDRIRRMARIRESLRAVKAEAFLDREQLSLVYGLMLPARSMVPLPRFNRVVLHAANTWKGGDNRLCLPRPENREAMEKDPVRRCRYVLLKKIYEHGFRDWLGDRTGPEIDRWVKRAEARRTSDARRFLRGQLESAERQKRKSSLTNRDVEGAEAKFSRMIRIGSGHPEPGAIGAFISKLASLTATEFRVQDNYVPNREALREQASWLEDLKLDVTALAFDAYLRKRKIQWLRDLRAPRGDAPPSGPSDGSVIDSLETPRRSADEGGGSDVPGDWQVSLYLVLHLVPVDDVARLFHRLRWWSTSSGMPAPPIDVIRLAEVLELYLDMHDARFGKLDGIADRKEIAVLFESTEVRDLVLGNVPEPGGPAGPGDAQGAPDDTGRRIPVRGLREMLRFGEISALSSVFARHPITLNQVKQLDGLDGNIATAQRDRAVLHKILSQNQSGKPDRIAKLGKDATKWKHMTQKEHLRAYGNALDVVTRHRYLSHHVRLTSHVRLHQIVMRVLGRLLDFSGLWERDLYFVTLALIYLDGRTPEQVLDRNARRKLRKGQIVEAVRGLDQETRTGLAGYFGGNFWNSDIGVVSHRNRAAHLNALWYAASVRQQPEALNLTREINAIRDLMRYDRKLRNAVSKAVSDAMERENMTLAWSMDNDHNLVTPKISGKTVRHLKKDSLTESLCSPDFIAMVAAVFGGSVLSVPQKATGGKSHAAAGKQHGSKSRSAGKPSGKQSHGKGRSQKGRRRWHSKKNRARD